MKKKFVSLLLVLLVVSTQCFAVPVDAKFHIRNRNPGYCMWCSIETTGRQQGILAVVGLVERRVQNGEIPGSTEELAKEQLNRLKVKHTIQYAGNRDLTLLKAAVMKRSAVVGISKYWNANLGSWQDGLHAILVTGFNEEEVEYVDSNCPGKTFVVPTKTFMAVWTGMTIVLLE